MITRRKFIKNVAIGTAAVSAGGAFPTFSAKSYKNIMGSNEKIRMGAIGVNSRGSALAAGFARQKGCEIAYVCDVDSRAMNKCIATIEELTGTKPKGEKDIRNLLALKDLDAVFIATPEHWHAPAALMAMKAGKHVYLEKPTSHNPAENEILMEAAKKYKVIVTTGMQRRSWTNVINAIQEVKEGAIGNVYFGKAWYANNRPPIGKGKIVAVPEWLDWELWQGPAPRVPHYKDNFLHYNWHWFYNWGTGESGNNAVHFIDLLRWGMDLTYPTTVNSSGGRYCYDDDWEFPDTQIINFEFGDDKLITWEGRSCNGRFIEDSSAGAAFYGDKGTLVIGGGNAYKIYDPENKIIKEVTSNLEFKPGDLINPAQQLDGFHFSNFLNGIKENIPLNADINAGCISSTLAQLGNISQRTKKTLTTDPDNGHILNDKDALKLWSRTYEKGWEMKL
ncbi:Gfo/Idh/MocA family protein [Anaerorudis cellulosivorans]|uniref:Gfo/Idh/MocA family protein n=1 Tax=Anaerorudis cellulosivorans TaxID=3397862 RepID=UPI002220EF6A|nr:Gfo/Idh/MocA family oxidoreductase [Seramator thermalis]MCW1734755.1 Gfo/Idh/MocA family oxidoreductase [Seramator thermalis]